MEKIFKNCSKWIKFFAKIGFLVIAAYGTMATVRDLYYEMGHQAFMDFHMYAFKAFAVLFVMYGFGKIVEHFETKDAPAAAPTPAPASAAAPAPAPTPAAEAVAEPAPVVEPAPAKTVKYCPNCGKENALNANFCEKCGTAL